MIFAWIFADARRHKARTAISILGVAVGVTALLYFTALGRGVETFARGPALEEDVALVEVVPKSMEIGIFRLNRPGLLGNSGLDRAMVERLERVPGITAVYPKRLLRLPMLAQGGGKLIGKDMATDLFAEGVDRELLARHVPAASLQWARGEPLPIVVSPELLQIFNGSVAEALEVPKLAKDALVGFQFDVIVGKSYLMGSNGAKRVEAMRGNVVGFSPWALRLGMSMPLDVVDALEAEFRTEDAPPVYTSVVVKLVDAADLPKVAAQLDKAGLKVSDSAKRTADAVRLATLFFALVAALVLLLATFNIGHGFAAQVVERRAELALLKALGATPFSVLRLIFSQAAVMGLLGGLLGVLTGYALGQTTERALARWVSEIPVRPERFFQFDADLFVLGMIAALLAATIGALLPALRVLADSPARVLSSVED